MDGAGDIQLINNHTILHARTAFTDWDDAEKRRHLFRIWLCPPVGRPLSPDWAEQARAESTNARAVCRL